MATTVLSSTRKNSNITLSGGNLVATCNASNGNSAGFAVDSLSLVTAGVVYYFEAVIGATANDQMIGIGNGVAETFGYPGTNTNSIAWHQPSGSYYYNGGATSSGIGAGAAGDVIGVAFTNTKIWWRRNGGQWMGNNASNNPLTGTGGVTHNLGGYLWPMYRVGINGTSLTFRFASSSWGTSLSGAQELVDTLSFGTDAAWNTLDYLAPITFSDSNYVATSGNNNPKGVRAVAGADSAQSTYIEFELAVGGGNWAAGISNFEQIMSARPLIRLDNNDGLRTITTPSGSFGTGYASHATTGDLLQCAITATKAWFRFNNTGNWNNASGHDPGTGAGGVTHALVKPYFPHAFLGTSGLAIRVRAKADLWIGTPPSGFVDIYGNAPADYLTRKRRRSWLFTG